VTRHETALALAVLLAVPVVAAEPIDRIEYFEGRLRFRDADLPVRLALEADSTTGARLDVPSLLYIAEALPTERRDGGVRIELPFGLGWIALERAGAGWTGAATLDGEPLTMDLSPAREPPYSSSEVRFASAGAQLAGTIVAPTPGAGRRPGIVLVHPSGDQSRARWEYRGWADFFARRGFVVALYDKRGCGLSSGAHWGDDEGFAGLADDALAAVELLRGRSDVDRERVGLFGGSQAGWVMLLAAARSPEVAFFVATSVPAVSPMEQMIQSVEYRMRADGIAQDELLAALAHMRLYAYVAATGHGWESLREAVEGARNRPFASYVFLPTADPRAGWMGHHMSFDPVPLLERIRLPVLALWGERDVIVPAAENSERFRAWFASGEGTLLTTRVFPGADHRLEVESGRDASGQWHWFGLAPGLFVEIDRWLAAQGVVSSAP